MSLDFWRNVAVIWLCFQGFFMLLIPLALFYFLVRGMSWVLRKTEPLFHKAQGYSGQMRNKTEAIADKVAQPLITVHSKVRQTETIVDTIARDARRPAAATSASSPSHGTTTAGGVTVVHHARG